MAAVTYLTCRRCGKANLVPRCPVGQGGELCALPAGHQWGHDPDADYNVDLVAAISQEPCAACLADDLPSPAVVPKVPTNVRVRVGFDPPDRDAAPGPRRDPDSRPPKVVAVIDWRRVRSLGAAASAGTAVTVSAWMATYSVDGLWPAKVFLWACIAALWLAFWWYVVETSPNRARAVWLSGVIVGAAAAGASWAGAWMTWRLVAPVTWGSFADAQFDVFLVSAAILALVGVCVPVVTTREVWRSAVERGRTAGVLPPEGACY